VIPSDYDTHPERWAVNRRVVERYGAGGDTHEPVAERLRREGLAPVLDIGCGDGKLAPLLAPSEGWIGVDDSPTQLAAAPRPVVLADATALPVRTGACGAVVALWMLYHVEDPTEVVREARRVLRPGGLFAACTTARDDSPELLAHLPPQPASTFDAEEAPSIVASVFDHVEVERWDGPFVHLPDRAAVGEYLFGRGIDEVTAGDVAAAVDAPLDITKRGVLVWARR